MIKFLDLQKINLAHQQEIEERQLQTFKSNYQAFFRLFLPFIDNFLSYILKRYLDESVSYCGN